MGNKCSEKLQINLHDVNGWKIEKNRERGKERLKSVALIFKPYKPLTRSV